MRLSTSNFRNCSTQLILKFLKGSTGSLKIFCGSHLLRNGGELGKWPTVVSTGFIGGSTSLNTTRRRVRRKAKNNFQKLKLLRHRKRENDLLTEVRLLCSQERVDSNVLEPQIFTVSKVGASPSLIHTFLHLFMS